MRQDQVGILLKILV